MALLMTFVLYFFKDILHVANPSAGTGIVAAASLVGAILSGLYLGWLSDRVPRKWVVAACGVPMALAAVGFGLVPQERWMFGFAFVFGIGFGGVLSTGWALAIDSVPKLRDVARDLGIWGIAQNFPAVIAPLIGGWLLSAYGGSLLGYRILFFIAGGSFAIASLVVLAVGKRPIIPWWGILLRYLAALCVRAYVLSVYRVRSWGTPVPLDGSLVIANHQIDQDLMAPISELAVAAGWRAPVIAASARMLFEPGFMAVRIPWLWRIFHNINMGWLFMGLGLLPLENELQTRAIARWAWAVQRRHGPLPLRDIFRPSAIERLGVPDLTSSDLFSARYFALGQRTPVRISELHAGYRKELLDEMRVGIEEDLSRIESAVRRGATYCVTPEGEYSTDGAMLPFRGIWDRLAPLAHHVILIGISYDPFVGKRLSQLYRVVELRDKENVVAELQAARPVTVSALIARWLESRQHPFTALEISEGVIQTLRMLPAQLFVDPELLESPVRRVREALKRMRELGILLTDGSRYVLSERRLHWGFPRVDDIVAFQAHFLAETIEGAQACAAPFRSYPAKDASVALRRCQNK